MSSEVKRYSVWGQFDHGLTLMTTREVVLAADYDALEAKCQGLRESLEVARTDELNAAVWAETDKLRHEMWDAVRERDQLRAEVEALRPDAAAGAVVWKFIDRMADPAECDPAGVILAGFVAAFDAAMAAKEVGK